MFLPPTRLTVTAFLFLLLLAVSGCLPTRQSASKDTVTAKEILGNPEYLAFSFGGYRQNTRATVPEVAQLKEDLRILAALKIKLLRTYNTQQYAHAARLLQAIRELKTEESGFEMYVMLGTWIECEGAWTASANHQKGNPLNNTAEIEAAVRLVNEYPDIVKIIAVGNEAMVQWAASYFVQPQVILDWVNHLQHLKQTGAIPADTWITSSDNYESWGGGASSYHTPQLAELIKAVDFVSLHTYPFHDSHYHPTFWGVPDSEFSLSDIEKIDAAMVRARDYAIAQYQQTADYISALGVNNSIHIGETGWASIAASSYGATGSRAADEYKQKLYYEHMRAWTQSAGMSCFYFEAFDEQWKDAGDPLGSENHFGLITLKGEAKFALWDAVDAGTFKGLTRDGMRITRTFNGDMAALLASIAPPQALSEMGLLETNTVNPDRKPGAAVTEDQYVVVHESLVPGDSKSVTYPSASLKLNAWEGTCSIELNSKGIVKIIPGGGDWWGCALEMNADGQGENLSAFNQGFLHLEAQGSADAVFEIGFQTGQFAAGNQTNNFIPFGPGGKYALQPTWNEYVIPVAELKQGANLADVTGVVFLRGIKKGGGKEIFLRNIYYSQQ